jgi:hypothetical protein
MSHGVCGLKPVDLSNLYGTNDFNDIRPTGRGVRSSLGFVE